MFTPPRHLDSTMAGEPDVEAQPQGKVVATEHVTDDERQRDDAADHRAS